MEPLNSVLKLETRIGKKMMNEIKFKSLAGDPEWLIDMCGELDYITEGSSWFIKEFHGPLLLRGRKAKDMDPDAILKEIEEWGKTLPMALRNSFVGWGHTEGGLDGLRVKWESYLKEQEEIRGLKNGFF